MLDITVARFCLQDSAAEKIETVRSPKFYQDSRKYSEIDKSLKPFLTKIVKHHFSGNSPSVLEKFCKI